MFDFTVLAKDGQWQLHDDQCGEIGRYDSRAEALAAVGEWFRVIDTPWPVLICDDTGHWYEAVIAPTVIH